MTESEIKLNEREAARLFQRGVAAARGGQRRVAAGLLVRVVQLDPRHEQGWLWLAGVIDDPAQISFCLRSVLTLNPQNERARQGLIWLEQQAPAQTKTQPTTFGTIDEEDDEHTEQRQARYEGESWWVNWRRSRRDMHRVRLVFWSIPLLLLLLTLGLNVMLHSALARNIVLAQAATLPSPTPPTNITATLLQAELPASRDAHILTYFSLLEAPRAQLRAAIDSYKEATNQPGGSSISHAAAARRLRDVIDTSYTTIAQIVPPTSLTKAHNDYLAGLEIERSALDDMLEFYSSFGIQIANRATLRLEEANKRLSRARTRFEEALQQANAQTIHTQAIR